MGKKGKKFYPILYRTNMNLWLSSGEPCDVFNSWFSWNTYKDYYADLTPYQDLMPNALEALGNFISNGYNGDQLLGLPAIKDWVSYSCYMMRKDIVEETGMNPEEALFSSRILACFIRSPWETEHYIKQHRQLTLMYSGGSPAREISDIPLQQVFSSLS